MSVGFIAPWNSILNIPFMYSDYKYIPHMYDGKCMFKTLVNASITKKHANSLNFVLSKYNFSYSFNFSES